MNDLLAGDTALFLYLNNLGNDTWDGFWLAVSSTKTWLPLYAVLLYLVARSQKSWLILWSILLVVANVFLTDQGSTYFFKEQFERLRPCHVEALIDQMRLVKASCGGQYGFLSAHAANTFGMAILVGRISKARYKFLLPILLIWAAFVSYSRVYIGVHYPLDILAGAVYGTFCGSLVYIIFNRLISSHYNEPA